jgi:hypothetical protein
MSALPFKSGHSSAQRFYKVPDFDHFLCPAAVPVIPIPLAFRRAAACAVEATNGRAVQKPDMEIHPAPPSVSDFLELKNRKLIHRLVSKIFRSETRISID